MAWHVTCCSSGSILEAQDGETPHTEAQQTENERDGSRMAVRRYDAGAEQAPSNPKHVEEAMKAAERALEGVEDPSFKEPTSAEPRDPDELRKVVTVAVENRRRGLDPGWERPLYPPSPNPGGELVGDESAMRSLQASIDAVAASSAPVLITGETGSGKELVARAIHARGDRRGNAFVAVNTAAAPADLLEAG